MITRTALLTGGVVLAIPVWALVVVGTKARHALKPGDPAPDFALPDQNGNLVRLSYFRGKRGVVLAFYVRAFTPT